MGLMSSDYPPLAAETRTITLRLHPFDPKQKEELLTAIRAECGALFLAINTAKTDEPRIITGDIIPKSPSVLPETPPNPNIQPNSYLSVATQEADDNRRARQLYAEIHRQRQSGIVSALIFCTFSAASRIVDLWLKL